MNTKPISTDGVASRPNHFYRQSAVLPYRMGRLGLEVMLITSRGGRRWIVPKGIVEPGLSPPQSAAKEAYEEAGLRGEVSDRSVGCYRHAKWNGICTITVYPMRVAVECEDWPERGERERCWLAVADASKRAHNRELAALIGRFGRFYQGGGRWPD